MFNVRSTQRVLFLDPGVGGTGWAYYRNVDGGDYNLPTTGVVFPKGATWQAKVRTVMASMSGVLSLYRPILVVAEFPRVWQEATSHASATRGDLFKLAYLVGALDRACEALDMGTVQLISPSDWKGQLPKDALKRRVEKLLGVSYQDHELDAVGMGLAAMGRL